MMNENSSEPGLYISRHVGGRTEEGMRNNVGRLKRFSAFIILERVY